MGYALAKIDEDETKIELQKARDLYEKGVTAALIRAIDKHPKFFISALVLMLIIVIVASLYFLKDKKFEVKTENIKVETQINEK